MKTTHKSNAEILAALVVPSFDSYVIIHVNLYAKVTLLGKNKITKWSVLCPICNLSSHPAGYHCHHSPGTLTPFQVTLGYLIIPIPVWLVPTATGLVGATHHRDERRFYIPGTNTEWTDKF